MNIPISVCIITKNEVRRLERCLQALSGLGMEIVVTDTGSSDGTKEMAKSYTESVYEFAWCDDFAAAKNHGVQQAKHDLVMILDSDEYLQPADISQLYHTIQSHDKEIGRIRIDNEVTRGGEKSVSSEWVSRIYDRRYYHYEGRIHEQLTVGSTAEAYSAWQEKKENAAGRTMADTAQCVYRTYQTKLSVLHDGYDGDEAARDTKAKRNIRLLLQEYERMPEDTYLLYQLGKSYYMSGKYGQAVHYFELALGYDLNPKLEYVIDMVETYGYALLNNGQADTALLLESVYEEFAHTADFQFLMGLIYMNNEHFDAAVHEFEKAAAHKAARVSGVNSYLAYYNAGVIRECLGDVQQALGYYRKCGSYEKALQRIKLLAKDA